MRGSLSLSVYVCYPVWSHAHVNFLHNKIPISGRRLGTGLGEYALRGFGGAEDLGSSLGVAGWKIGSPGAELKEPRQEGTKDRQEPQPSHRLSA